MFRRALPGIVNAMRIFLGLLTLAIVEAASPRAQTLRELPPACRVERMEQAVVACIAAEEARLQARMDTRISQTTSDLQAATGSEIRLLEQGLADAQLRWQDAAVDGCATAHPDAPVGNALCLLEAAALRDDRLRESLDALRAELGANPLYPLPDPSFVETFIPLELPPGIGGPNARTRFPLLVPVQPN